MKLGFAIGAVLAGLLATATAADWQKSLTPPKPGAFPLPKPQVASYRFGWSAIPAAEADFDFSRPRKGLMELKVTTKTIGAVRGMWKMDSQHVSLATTELRPIRLQQVERYSKETETTKAEFDAEGVSRTNTVEPSDGTPVKTKRFKMPGVFDLHTGLLFVRSQRLKVGDTYRFVAHPGGAPYLAIARVEGKETLTVAEGTHPAIKLSLELHKIDKKMQLQAHKKFKKANAWFSDDQERLLLKVDAEVFVGSVWCELQSVKYAEKKVAGKRR